jgi:putative PIN family toxin of toxin-antitoxin system
VPTSSVRLVADTNVVLRGLLNTRSASGKILEVIENRSAVLLLSKPVLAEYRAVLTDPVIVERYPELTIDQVEVALRRFRYFGEYLRVVRASFEFARDPRDAMLIELAISGKATDLVSFDKDLLSLPFAHTDAAKRLRQRQPGLRILRPAEFLSVHAPELG